MTLSLSSLGNTLTFLTALFGAFLAALWLSSIFWTLRDIRSRTSDRAVHVFATALVTVLFLPGVIVYLIVRPRRTLEEQYQITLEEEALLAQVEGRQICPGCGGVTERDWQACVFCHTRLRKPCVECASLLELAWHLCPYCATPVPGKTREDEMPRTPNEGTSEI